ncbi:hypothetical protein B0A49_10930 [Cryomyces minteri]|uniref:Uncharacterized protein n=1 Tax=Cryomyces minteri TaxID=331657 RepID=A0A4U0WLY5_9PEZI|nr:hypothetical protein B0A49_10930 [Cryomyces minteri]
MPTIPTPDYTASRPLPLELRDLVTSFSHLVPNIFHQTQTSHSLPLSQSSSSALHQLVKRQTYNTVAIPTVYQGLSTDPQPGTVIGIVLGSVAGFILIVGLFYSLANSNNGRNTISADEDIVVRRGATRSRSPKSRKSRRSDREISRSPRRERVIVEERIREVNRAPPPMMSMPPRARSIVVEDRRVSGDDIVEVIEEHSDIAPRRKSRRSSGYRSVDPDLYAGGAYPQREVYGGRGSRR